MSRFHFPLSKKKQSRSPAKCRAGSSIGVGIIQGCGQRVLPLNRSILDSTQRATPPGIAPRQLCPLATPQPHGLAVLLQLGNQLVTLADHILVLLVLIVGSVRLDNALAGDTVDGTRYAAGGDESG